MSGSDVAATAATGCCMAGGATGVALTPAGLNISEGLQPRKRAPYCSRCTGIVERRPGPNGGKAAGVGEATGPCTRRAAGGGVPARRERDAEITSGRSSSQPGLTATGTDPLTTGETGGKGRVEDCRMSP